MSVQFVFCGLAGFAATVGLAYAKHRLSPTQDPPSSTAEHASALGTGAKELGHQDEKDYAHPEHMSLKRKSVDDHDSLSTRPRKKSRSPPAEEAIEFPDVIYGLPARAPAIAPPAAESTDDICMTSPNTQPRGILPLVLEAEAAELRSRDAPQSQFVLEKTQDVLGPLLPAAAEVAEVAVLDSTPIAPAAPVAPVAPITPPSSPPPTFAKRVPGRGFSAFAGSGSGAGAPFAASSLSPQRRPSFAATTPPRPVWRSAEVEDGAVPPTSSPSPFAPGNNSSSSSSALSPSPNGPNSPRPAPEWVGPADAGPADALAAVETRVTTPIAHVTGEENEVVTAELKGVKLFIKRGNKAFTGGMPGHIKRLAHADSERADQRLLFRREPLGKVSMNVPMGPAVRCSFDAEDGILRVVLKEAATTEGGNGAHELVVYAVKRGRVPKQEFTEFAETLTAAYAPKAAAGTT